MSRIVFFCLHMHQIQIIPFIPLSQLHGEGTGWIISIGLGNLSIASGSSNPEGMQNRGIAIGLLDNII